MNSTFANNSSTVVQCVYTLTSVCIAATAKTAFKPTRLALVLFSQLTAAVVYAIRAWFKYDTALSVVI